MNIRIKFTTLTTAALAILASALTSQAYAQSRTVEYDCQNGPPLIVTYQRQGNTLSLRYVYDGPRSAMRKMRMHRGNKRHFKDGANSITLEPNPGLVDYREGNDLYDRCRAVSGF